MKKIYKNCRLLLPDGILPDGMVVVDDEGKIEYAGIESNSLEIDGEFIDLGGKILSPGFIDIHVHGGNGVTFGAGDLPSNTAHYSQWVVKTGVTGYLMSIAEKTSARLIDMIEEYVGIFENPPEGAETLGLHLEGPFLNVEKK